MTSREWKPKLSQDFTASIATRSAAWALAGGGIEGLKDQKRDVLHLGFATCTSPSLKPGLTSHSLTFTAVKESIIEGSVKQKKGKN